MFSSIRVETSESISKKMHFYSQSRQSSVSNEALSNNPLIIEKSSQKDYQFFLTQGNFLKVVDTLEKFESSILNPDSAKDFVLFKRQLYTLYEV